MDTKADERRAAAMRASGCEALWEYLQDAEETVWFKLRMQLDWDEESFRRMVQALINCLEATEGAELVPRALAYMFVYPVPTILALMARPDFLPFNAGERSPEEARAYFARRQQLLQDLSHWFTDGRKLVKDDRLSVGDWSPTFRRIEPGSE